jgi:hypothetical protein
VTSTAPENRRVVSPRPTVKARNPELAHSRELPCNQSRKHLKVKYKNSALGFVWSLLNPLLYLVIFSTVLGVFLRFGFPYYAFYLLSGLLAWNLFVASVAGATGSIVGNSNLVSKVYFPREILPLSAIGAALVHFVLQLFVLLAAMDCCGIRGTGTPASCSSPPRSRCSCSSSWGSRCCSRCSTSTSVTSRICSSSCCCLGSG